MHAGDFGRQGSDETPDDLSQDSTRLTEKREEEDGRRVEKEEREVHPAGVKLHRSDYYTSPTLEELKELVDSEGECW